VIALLLSSALNGLPPSEAVLTAYHMACNVGELHLEPGEAKIVSGDRGSTPFPLWEWGSAKTLTYIYLKYPKDTHIAIATYNAKYPQQTARVCAVYSNAITREDAERAFLSAVAKPDVWRDLNPARANEPFEIDRPKEGFWKKLMFRDGGRVIMETGMYKAPH
jgi:hypothetical protein